MATRNVHLHLGPPLPGIGATHDELRRSRLLTHTGLAVPRVEQADMDRADIEIRRRHKELGLSRRQVEGAWSQVCRQAFKQARRGWDVVISQPGFLEAEYRQVALALDGLVGLRLHLVLTPIAPPEPRLVGSVHHGPRDVAGNWGRFVKGVDRIHVLPLHPGSTPDDLAEAIVRAASPARHHAA